MMNFVTSGAIFMLRQIGYNLFNDGTVTETYKYCPVSAEKGSLVMPRRITFSAACNLQENRCVTTTEREEQLG